MTSSDAPVKVDGGDVAVMRPEVGPEVVSKVSPSVGESGSVGSWAVPRRVSRRSLELMRSLSFSTGSWMECSLNRSAVGIRLT